MAAELKQTHTNHKKNNKNLKQTSVFSLLFKNTPDVITKLEKKSEKRKLMKNKQIFFSTFRYDT